MNMTPSNVSSGPVLLSLPLSPNDFMSSLNGFGPLPSCVSFFVFSPLPDDLWWSLFSFFGALSPLLSVSFLVLEVLSPPPHNVLCQPLSLQRLRPLLRHHFLSSFPNDLSRPLSPSLDGSPVLQAVPFNRTSLKKYKWVPSECLLNLRFWDG